MLTIRILETSRDKTDLKCREIKRYKALSSLDLMRFLMQRIPELKECLDTDLITFTSIINESGLNNIFFSWIDSLIRSLNEEKLQLEKEVQASLQKLKEMNEIERRSIEVNAFPKKEELQTWYFRFQLTDSDIEKTHNHILRIETEISKLRKKMEEDSTKLHSIFEAFVKVKNEILGIQIQESLDEDEQMEVEESHVCE